MNGKVSRIGLLIRRNKSLASTSIAFLLGRLAEHLKGFEARGVRTFGTPFGELFSEEFASFIFSGN